MSLKQCRIYKCEIEVRERGISYGRLMADRLIMNR